MSPLRVGQPFGFDSARIDEIDWNLANNRIEHDVRSDFIFAPHLRVIYAFAAESLIESLTTKLRSGTYLPGPPLTIEVPKSSRIRVQSKPPRPGPNYSRPGSILMPIDRLFYQMLADVSAHVVDLRTDRTRSFSHEFDEANPERFFLQSRECWSKFQAALKVGCEPAKIKYVLKLDIANFFSSINLHSLINTLSDAGLAKPFTDRLEVSLTTFTGSRSSRGILQGLFASDMFGNFYLEPFDRFMGDLDISTARYVDDIYIFLDSVAAADKTVKSIIPHLRQLDLSLNEAKSNLFPKSALVVEEPDLEELFQNAISEIRDQIEEKDLDVAYGFQAEWEDSDEEIVEIELRATIALFDSLGSFRGHEEEIERFCLPLFIRSNNDYAVEHVLSAFRERPSMSQIYCAYLSRFIDDERVYTFLTSQVTQDNLYDWQTMWIIAALLQRNEVSDEILRKVVRVYRDPNRHDATRAVAAIFIGTKGDNVRRNELSASCNFVSPYVQSAIFFAAQRWPRAERGNFNAQWGQRSEVNRLIGLAWEELERETGY